MTETLDQKKARLKALRLASQPAQVPELSNTEKLARQRLKRGERQMAKARTIARELCRDDPTLLLLFQRNGFLK